MPSEPTGFWKSLVTESNPFDADHSGRQAMLGNALTWGLPAAAVGAGVGALASKKGRRLRGAGIGALTGLLGVGGTMGLVGRHQARQGANDMLDRATSYYQGTFVSPESDGKFDPEHAATDPVKNKLYLRQLYDLAEKSDGGARLSPDQFGKLRDERDNLNWKLDAPSSWLPKEMTNHTTRAASARDDHFREKLRGLRLPTAEAYQEGMPQAMIDLTAQSLAPSHRQSPDAEYARHLARTYRGNYRAGR